MDSAHTKTPWKVNNVFIENAENQYFVSEAKWGGANIAACGSSVSGDWDINEANAAFIVKCVNHHDELVQALKEATRRLRLVSSMANQMPKRYAAGIYTEASYGDLEAILQRIQE